MRNRQANGLSKSGRYKAEDTARLKYIHCTGFPLIQKGLLPLPHDIHMLESGALETLRGQDKVNLEQWVRKHYSDPRSKNKVQLNDMQQTSILEWCSLNTQLLSTIIRTCGCRISQTQNGIRSIQLLTPTQFITRLDWKHQTRILEEKL